MKCMLCSAIIVKKPITNSSGEDITKCARILLGSHITALHTASAWCFTAALS
uniref:Uncharacterized protein n=1 Tax=Rhizophora mucronata TaxID=61149 RepID=A0A2P2N2W8_RHIMU